MSSPPQQLSFSGFPNLSSSPMKGFSYYFSHDNTANQPPSQEFHFQDENVAPHDPSLAGAGLQYGSDFEEVVPVSQHNGIPLAPVNQNQQMFNQYPQQALQMPLKFEITPVQQNFIAQHQMPPPQHLMLQQDEQKNLFPAMHVFRHSQSTSNIPQSASMNTLASFDSAPGLTVSHSASDNSLAMSPVSFQNANQTPRRVIHRRPSIAITPLPQVFESPVKNKDLVSPVATRSHSHSSISTQTPTAKLMRHRRTRSRLSLDLAGGARSPSGTNPFYSAFMSPHQQNSPSGTPMQTPHRNAVSPNVLVNMNGMIPFRQPDDQSKLVFAAAADYTMKMATDHYEKATMPHFRFQNVPSDTKPLARSQSSIDLASIAGVKSPPPEIQCFDLLEPRRKKMTKLSSMPPGEDCTKKSHECPLCGSRFQRPEHVKRHMRSHSSEKPFFCDEAGCGKRFNRADNMKAHLRKIHKRDI